MASSSRYRIEIKASAARAIEGLATKEDRRRVLERIATLADDPRPPGCSKLAGRDDHFRLRQGRYRIIYRIEDERLIVIVVAVGHRRDVYRSS